jgi:hypothetical protein
MRALALALVAVLALPGCTVNLITPPAALPAARALPPASPNPCDFINCNQPPRRIV